MATTKGKIREQAQRLIKGGNVSVPSTVQDEEMDEVIGQVLNEVLKVDYFGVNLPSGETIPNGYVLACYDGITVETYKNKSRAKLPAIPIMLPRNMGVFHVGDADDPDCQYIPIPNGQGPLLKNQGLINDLLGKTGYDVRDGYVVFNKDITPKNVDMQLVVMDMAHYGEYDLLPIPADMENKVVQECVNRFSNKPSPDKQVDSSAEPSKQAK